MKRAILLRLSLGQCIEIAKDRAPGPLLTEPSNASLQRPNGAGSGPDER